MMRKQKGLLVLPSIKNIEEIINGLSIPVELTKGSYSELEFRFLNNTVKLIHSGIDIREYSDVWLTSYWNSRDLAYAVDLYLGYFKTKHTQVEKVISKITDQIIFTTNKIPSPDTFFIDNVDILDYLSRIESICSYPLIIKDITGSGGIDSVLIKNRKDLLAEIKIFKKYKKYMFQKFIPNEYDWGVLVADGNVVSGEKSYPEKGEFRNNSCNGASEIFSDLEAIPEEVKEIAVKASTLLGLRWSRSDIIIDKNNGKPYLLEVNRCPGITSGTTEVQGAKKFLENHLRAKYKDEKPLSVLYIN